MSHRDKEKKPVDRLKVCPLLLRLFLSKNRHHTPIDFKDGHIPPPMSELQIYTWTDATLTELMGLVREVREEYRQKGTTFNFSVVYPEPRSPGYRMRDIGETCGGKTGPDDDITLAQSRFQIGDYIDVAIRPPGIQRPRGKALIQTGNRNKNRPL